MCPGEKVLFQNFSNRVVVINSAPIKSVKMAASPSPLSTASSSSSSIVCAMEGTPVRKQIIVCFFRNKQVIESVGELCVSDEDILTFVKDLCEEFYDDPRYDVAKVTCSMFLMETRSLVRIRNTNFVENFGKVYVHYKEEKEDLKDYLVKELKAIEKTKKRKVC